MLLFALRWLDFLGTRVLVHRATFLKSGWVLHVYPFALVLFFYFVYSQHVTT